MPLLLVRGCSGAAIGVRVSVTTIIPFSPARYTDVRVYFDGGPICPPLGSSRLCPFLCPAPNRTELHLRVCATQKPKQTNVRCYFRLPLPIQCKSLNLRPMSTL